MVILSDRHIQLNPPIEGFEGILRYWDKYHAVPAAKILPGEYYITDENELVTTVLGSCVSACVRDRVLGIGGMNHFMLPITADGKGWSGLSDFASTATRYGNFAMEHMINRILTKGGYRKNLEAKIFGGGQIQRNLSNVGQLNIDFVHEYLEIEGIPIVSEDSGGAYPRKVVYFPRSGRVMMKKLKQLHNDTIVVRESKYRAELSDLTVKDDIEIF